MKITVKFVNSDKWEELEILSEEEGIQAIRIDDVILTEDSIRHRTTSQEMHGQDSPKRIRPLEITDGSAHERESFFDSHFYGMVDVIKRRVLNIHGPLQDHLGFDPSVLTGRDFFEFIHPDDIDKIRRSFSSLLEGQSVIDLHHRVISNHEEYTHLSMSLSQAQEGIAAFYLKILEIQEAPKETIYGYLPDELVGLTPKMLLPKQNFSYFQGTLRNAKIMAEKKKPIQENPIKYDRLCADGSSVRVLGMITQCDLAQKKMRLLEREVGEMRKVISLTIDFEGTILGCKILEDLVD